jgi:hypothetical protein
MRLPIVALIVGLPTVLFSQEEPKLASRLKVLQDAAHSVWVDVRVTNISQQVVAARIALTPQMGYTFAVTAPDGRPAARRQMPLAAGSVVGIDLAPGESKVSGTYSISDEFDFSTPGTYRIVATPRGGGLPLEGRVSTGLLMFADIEKAAVKAGDPLIIHFHVKNVSSEAISVTADDAYEVLVAGNFGREPRRTPYGEGMPLSFPISSPGMQEIGPSADGPVGSLDLAKIYDLTPGQYHVEAFLGRGHIPDPKTGSNDPRGLLQSPIEEEHCDPLPFRILLK